MKVNILVIFTIILLLTSCQSKELSIEKGMVKVTILYPNTEGKTFNMDYYSNKHMPMIADLFGNTLKSYKIDEGIGGRTSQDPIPYLAIGYLYFDSLEDYEKVFAPNAKQILEDIPNYTNIQPVLQVSKVKF